MDPPRTRILVAKLKRHLVLMAALPVLIAGDLGNAARAGCLKDEREVALGDGSARLRSYLCRRQGADRPQVRMEYHRLSEVAAGSLLQGTPYPDVERVIGRTQVANNAVRVEAKTLFDKFGTKQDAQTCYRLKIDTPRGGKNYDNKTAGEGELCGNTKRTLWYLSFPDRMGSPSLQMPSPDDELVVQKRTTWPEGYSFFYDDCPRNPGTPNGIVECTLLWRGATRSDLQRYIANLRRHGQMTGADNGADIAGITNVDKYFRLVAHVMGNGWHNDFLTIVGTYAGCGGFAFALHIRQLILDVAVIENMTQQPIVLDGLLGGESPDVKLRKSEFRTAAETGSAILPGSRLEIRAREKIVVPLRMSWMVSSDFRELFAKPAVARVKYERIQRAPQGTMFREKDPSENVRISKVRESFRPPSMPSFDIFVYGPEINLRGFVMNGERVLFDETSRNFIAITAGDAYGSCPFLYVWDDSMKDWIWYGKVIHQANAKSKETTHEVVLKTFSTRFRLAEEELELSHIDYAGLRLEIRDGSRHLLQTERAELAKADGHYLRIKPGQAVEFEFGLPPGLDALSVTHATLIVKGYYEPYSRMELSER